MKTAMIHLCVSGLCVAADYGYTLLGHGVTSVSMLLMFLYPLVGGTVGFLLLWLLLPDAEAVPGYRLCYNLYNAGIAALVAGSMLRGVMEIAGTSSPYTAVFFPAGWLLAGGGAAAFGWNARKYLRNRRQAHAWNGELDAFFGRDRDP